jgi:hypothetical protein
MKISSVVLSFFFLISVVSMTSVSARDWKEGDYGQVRWDSYCRYVAIIFPTSTAAIANVDEFASPILDALTSHKGMESVTCTKVSSEGVSTMAGHLGGFVVTFPIVFIILLRFMEWDNRKKTRLLPVTKNSPKNKILNGSAYFISIVFTRTNIPKNENDFKNTKILSFPLLPGQQLDILKVVRPFRTSMPWTTGGYKHLQRSVSLF